METHMTVPRILSIIFGLSGAAFLAFGIGKGDSGLLLIAGAILAVSLMLLLTSGRCGTCCKAKGRSGPPSSGDGDAALITGTTTAVAMMAATTISSD